LTQKEAASQHRGDVCQLLGQLGVKADPDFSGKHPVSVLSYYDRPYATSQIIDIIRFFTQEAYVTDDVNTLEYVYLPVGVLVWAWRNREEIFYGQDTSLLGERCIFGLVCQLHHPVYSSLAAKYLKGEFAPLLEKWILEYYGLPRFLFPYWPWRWRRTSAHGYEAGELWLEIVAGMGIDIAEYSSKAMREGPIIFPSHVESEPSRKVVFDYTPGVGWRLGWEWEYDKELAGYLVASEFSGLAADTYKAGEVGFTIFGESVDSLSEGWPWESFRVRDEWQQTARFDRRNAAKARKELARMGLKQSRSKMPGSWIE
jgi:hypothetical protein